MAAPVPVEAVQRGVALFNRGRYFDAHELWETAWRDAPAEERQFLEGLVQLAAGIHLRTERGGTRGAVHLLGQALVLLEDYRPAHAEVDVDTLIDEFGTYVAWLREVDRPHRLLDRRRIPRLRGV